MGFETHFSFRKENPSLFLHLAHIPAEDCPQAPTRTGNLPQSLLAGSSVQVASVECTVGYYPNPAPHKCVARGQPASRRGVVHRKERPHSTAALVSAGVPSCEQQLAWPASHSHGIMAYSGNMNPSWLNAGAGQGAAPTPTSNANANISDGSNNQPSWLNPPPRPVPAQEPTKSSKASRGWFSSKSTPTEITSVAVDGPDLRQAPAQGARGGAAQPDGEADEGCDCCSMVPEKCFPENRCVAIGSALGVSIVCDAFSFALLTNHYLIAFGVVFLLSFVANLTTMLIFFGPRKYLRGMFTRKRVVSTVFFFGLTFLVVILCFTHGVYWVVMVAFIAQQVAWAFNFAAGCAALWHRRSTWRKAHVPCAHSNPDLSFGFTPCAIPEPK